MFPKNTLHTIMSYNTKVVALQMYLAKFEQIGYTSDEIDIMMAVMEVKYVLHEVLEEYQEFLDSLTKQEKDELEKLGNKMENDPEIREYYQYKDEQTRHDIKEVLNTDKSLSELIDYFDEI